MRFSRVCVLAGAAVSAAILSFSVAPAQAADLGYGSVKDIPPPPPSGRAWYLKGTIGMKNAEPDSIWTNGHGNDGYQTGDFTVHHTDIKSTALYGFGIGIEHSRWLRFDVTGEYRGKQLFVAQDSYNNGGPCPGTGCGTNEYTADIESWLGLVNAYIDLGTWRGITPYVGGGIGIASLDVQGFKDVNVPRNSVFYGDKDNSTTNFAWALYAGISYDVTPQFTLDLGYRYTDLGDAHTGRATNYLGTDSYQGLEIRDIVSHDLLFSARYRLDQPQPVYPVSFK
ncbi:MAG: porin family protein [Hyphomicrobium zavarzinii]|jgi:opacity protein-like surface antigen|uniref:outer membrane protein n=1 Tax=Hyphomicrobium zavarzinii TaxID=48292 RepID=UPI001A38C75B|nr:outer membrane beta-barrel protein [Hyphomicrobium zavarzinii]MBL8846692.1 porin family protein [Hyphomicrobium zavarzinii]